MHSCIAEIHVETAMCGHGRFHQSIDVFGPPDIDGDEGGLPVRGADLRYGPAGGSFIDIGDYNSCAFAREGARRGVSDPVSATSNNNDLVLEAPHDHPKTVCTSAHILYWSTLSRTGVPSIVTFENRLTSSSNSTQISMRARPAPMQKCSP